MLNKNILIIMCFVVTMSSGAPAADAMNPVKLVTNETTTKEEAIVNKNSSTMVDLTIHPKSDVNYSKENNISAKIHINSGKQRLSITGKIGVSEFKKYEINNKTYILPDTIGPVELTIIIEGLDEPLKIHAELNTTDHNAFKDNTCNESDLKDVIEANKIHKNNSCEGKRRPYVIIQGKLTTGNGTVNEISDIHGNVTVSEEEEEEDGYKVQGFLDIRRGILNNTCLFLNGAISVKYVDGEIIMNGTLTAEIRKSIKPMLLAVTIVVGMLLLILILYMIKKYKYLKNVSKVPYKKRFQKNSKDVLSMNNEEKITGITYSLKRDRTHQDMEY